MKLILSFFDRLDTILRDIQPVGRRLAPEAEQVLARYCFVLALFEEVYRGEGLTGRAQNGPLLMPAPKKSVEELLTTPQNAWVDDLCAMSWLFYDQCRQLLSQPSVLNPMFTGSSDVGGADADFIVDQCLVELKASVQLKIEPEWLWQLAGYLLLDYVDTYQITSVGIYMARQGMLFTWPVEEFLHVLTSDTQTSLGGLRQEFRSRFSNRPSQHTRK